MANANKQTCTKKPLKVCATKKPTTDDDSTSCYGMITNMLGYENTADETPEDVPETPVETPVVQECAVPQPCPVQMCTVVQTCQTRCVPRIEKTKECCCQVKKKPVNVCKCKVSKKCRN